MSHFRAILIFCLIACVLWACAIVRPWKKSNEYQEAHEDKVNIDNSFEDLNLLYLKAYNDIKKSESAIDPEESIQFLSRALSGFDSIHKINPNWKKTIVTSRISDTKTKLTVHGRIDIE